MKFMVNKEAYTDIVKKHFNYLIQSYEFAECPLEVHARFLVVAYCKGELLIKVEYSHTNQTIEVAIYNHISVVPPGSYDWRYSVSLSHLMKRDLPQFDYERDYKSLMPSNLPLVEAVKRMAVLFERHAVNIISEKEWVSWGELTGYSQSVPPELP
jgi:hypothetical protein